MSSAWSRILGPLAGLLAGGAFLALAFRSTPPAAVWELLRHGRWGLPALLVVAGTGLFVLAKVARWRYLLGAGLRRRTLAPPVLSGLALNALIPHSGEFVRAVAVARSTGQPASAVLSSIVAERVFDLFGVLILGSLAAAFTPANADLAMALRLIGAIAALLALCVVAFVSWPQSIERLVSRCTRPLPPAVQQWVARHAAAALLGLAPVKSVATSVRVLAWSVVQWLAVALAVYGCAAVIGFDAGLAATCLVVVGIVVAFLLPNAPGYAGSVQVAFLVTLVPLGVAREAALAASIVYQLLMVLPLIVVGLACLGPTLAKR